MKPPIFEYGLDTGLPEYKVRTVKHFYLSVCGPNHSFIGGYFTDDETLEAAMKRALDKKAFGADFGDGQVLVTEITMRPPQAYYERLLTEDELNTLDKADDGIIVNANMPDGSGVG